MKATGISFERIYCDSSGVEFGVRLVNNHASGETNIDLKCRGSEASFPADEIDWLIACLQRIKEEIKP